jgi:hypothetical protein
MLEKEQFYYSNGAETSQPNLPNPSHHGLVAHPQNRGYLAWGGGGTDRF